jgi:hypothetical protein
MELISKEVKACCQGFAIYDGTIGPISVHYFSFFPLISSLLQSSPFRKVLFFLSHLVLLEAVRGSPPMLIQKLVIEHV